MLHEWTFGRPGAYLKRNFSQRHETEEKNQQTQRAQLTWLSHGKAQARHKYYVTKYYATWRGPSPFVGASLGSRKDGEMGDFEL